MGDPVLDEPEVCAGVEEVGGDRVLQSMKTPPRRYRELERRTFGPGCREPVVAELERLVPD